NANGASILAFFDDGDSSNNRDIVLFDGNDSNAANPYDALGWNVTLSGINYTSGRAFIELHVSDGQVYPDAAVIVNGTIVQQGGDIFQGESVPHANDGPMQRGSLWDIMTWEITSVLEPGSNDLLLTHSFIGKDCISLVAAVINLPVGAAPPPPPVNHPPELSGIPELTINSTNAIPLIADVRDDDGDPLTYRISIDGVEVKTGSIPAGLPITTETLSVTNSLGLGQHTVVFSANDGKSSASLTTRVNVIDNTPPVLHLPPNMIVPADLDKSTALVNYVVTATDDFPGVLVISLPASGTEFPIGVTTGTVTAVDTSGNATTGTFTITVTDSTPPIIHCPADIIQATDAGSSNAVVYYTVPATDNMPGVSLTCTPPSGSVFSIGITTVVCLARDAAGNAATCMFRVTIVDREPPVINASTNIVTVSDLNQCSAIVQYDVSVHDNTPGVSLICEPPSGSAFPV
ncbi:MAG TPA: HYR domain-containing protein, partial [Candidatus Dormibacteraeota bacterium]|nr:HYR domain-containing protein [Candidatus Dormibacteraeota bacterium]